MANLTETSLFEAGIYRLETADPVLAGAGGVSNTQAQQLVNRTRYLYDQQANAGIDGGQAKEFSGDLNTLTNPGFVLVRSGATNKPTTGAGHLIVTGRQSVPEASGLSACQLYVSLTNGLMYFRVANATVWSQWFGVQTTLAADLFRLQFVGMVSHFAVNVAPAGWLACNGAAVNRTTYSDLFNRVGTTFGAGNGSTTFNLPDLRGEFIRGWDDGRGVDIGHAFGSFQDDQAQLVSHSHISYAPDYSSVYVLTQPGPGAGISQVSNNFSSVGTNTTGTGNANETRPRNIALLACIKY